MAIDLSSLLSGSHTRKYNDVEIEIKEVSLEQLPSISKILVDFNKKEGSTNDKILSFITNDIDSARKLVVSLTNIPYESINKISLDAILFIVKCIIEVNHSFLEQKLAPIIKEMSAIMNGMSKSKS